jgi:hypothetical protein
MYTAEIHQLETRKVELAELISKCNTWIKNNYDKIGSKTYVDVKNDLREFEAELDEINRKSKQLNDERNHTNGTAA